MDLLDQHETAAATRLSERTLEQHRAAGTPNAKGGPLSTLSHALNLDGAALIAAAAEIIGAAPPAAANGHDRRREDDLAKQLEIERKSGNPLVASPLRVVVAGGIALTLDVRAFG